MSFRFRLEPVLRLRRAEWAQARALLAQAHGVLRAAHARRDAEVTRYEAVRAEPLATGVPAFAAAHHDATLAAARIAQADDACTSAAAVLADATRAYTVARQRVAVLERLEERRRAEHVAAQARAEAAVLDEIATARHLAATRGEAR